MIARLEWQQQRKSLLIWLLIFLVITWGFTSIYPQMHSKALSELVDGKLTSLSPALLKTFNIEGSGIASFTTALGFFAYYFQYLFLAALCYVMLISTQALVKEETDGTIEFLYAQPVTRSQLFLQKWLAVIGIASLFWLLVFLNALAAVIVFKAKSDQLDLIIKKLALVFMQEGLLLFLFLNFGLWLSTCLKSSRQSMGISLGSIFFLYLIGIVGELDQKFNILAHISLIHMAIPSKLLTKNFSLSSIALYLSISVFCFLVGWHHYRKKDLSNH